MPDYGFQNSSAFQTRGGAGFGFASSNPNAGYGFASSLPPTGTINPLGKIQGFAASAIEAFPELFGEEASPEVQAFRARNPVSGFVSQLVGTGAFYGIAERGLLEIPAAARLVEGLAARAAPGAARTAVRLATQTALVDTARVGLAATGLPSALTGRERTESLPDLAGGAVLNTAFAGALGAVGGAISSRLASGPRVYDLVPEAHPSQPMITRIRALDAATTAMGPDGVSPLFDDPTRGMLAHERDKLTTAAMNDIVPAYNATGNARIDGSGIRRGVEVGDIIRPLENDGATRPGRLTTTAFLRRVFNYDNVNVGRVTETRLLTVDPAQGFATDAELNAAIGRIGRTPAQLAQIGQDMRVVRVNTGVGAPGNPAAANPMGTVGVADRSARALETRFTDARSPFRRVGNDWFLAREADDGLWVAAKKINGRIGSPAPGDEWFMGRFDTPDALDPQAAAFRTLTIDRSAYFPKPATGAMIGAEQWDVLSQFERAFEKVVALPARVRPTPNHIVAGARDVAELFGQYVSPTSALGAVNPRANYIVNMMKFATDFEGAMVGNAMEGARSVAADETPLRQYVANLVERRAGGGFHQLVESVPEAAMADVQNALEAEMPIEFARRMATAGKIDPGAMRVLEAMDALQQGNINSFEKIKTNVNTSSAIALLADFSPRRGHYGITRTRHGGFHAYIEDTAGNIAGWTGGNTAREARDGAMTIIANEFKRTGRELRFGGMGDELLATGDGWDRFTAAIRRPGFIRERGQLVGYDLQKEPLTRANLVKLVEQNLQARARSITNIVLHEKTWEPLHRLEQENAGLAVQMRKRLAILQGDEGNFAAFQNNTMDKLLGGVLGKNSASTIIRGTQRAMNAFQFGFGNISTPILNAVSIAQVMMPEVAFVLRGQGRDLTDYLTVPTTNAAGHPIGAVSVLSDIKMMRSAFQLLGTNERHLPQDFKDLLQEMADQRLIAPRFAEQEPGGTGSAIKRALEGTNATLGDWAQTAHAANQIMMAKTEEFNRLVGVATAYRLAKAIGISDQFRLGRFTREFISKVAFNYSTADRPTVFTTPIGSLMGTFKTWMFHYMANMVKYTGEASRGNFAPLLWQTATTALVAGSVGTPLAMPIANAASQFFANKPAMDLLYNDLLHDNHQLADGLMYGLPGLFGVSLAAQASSPGADPARDASMMFSFAAWDRARAVGRAVGGAWEGYRVTGQSPFENDMVRDQMVRAFAPRTLYRAMSISEDHAIRSLSTGYRVMDNVSLGSGLLYAAGFTPAQLDTTYAAYSEIRNDQQARRAATVDMGRAMAEAWADNDSHLANRIYSRGLAMGIPMESVLRSARARQERAQQTQLGYTIGGPQAGDEAARWDWLAPPENANVPPPSQ